MSLKYENMEVLLSLIQHSFRSIKYGFIRLPIIFFSFGKSKKNHLFLSGIWLMDLVSQIPSFYEDGGFKKS